MSKTITSMRLDSDLLAKLKARAKKENRTLSNLIETLLTSTIEKPKKP